MKLCEFEHNRESCKRGATVQVTAQFLCMKHAKRTSFNIVEKKLNRPKYHHLNQGKLIKKITKILKKLVTVK